MKYQVIHVNTNLVPRVLWLFGQRVDASRDSGIMEQFNFFDWSSASRLFYVIFFIPKIRRTPIQRQVLNYVSETISSRLNISRFIVGSLPLLSYDGKMARPNASSLN